MRQAATRVADEEYELFQEITANLGTTTSDALRIFIHAFNDYCGFPFALQSKRMNVESFKTEEEATRFATDWAMELLDETR